MKNLRALIMCLAVASMMASCDLHLSRSSRHSPTGPTVTTDYVGAPDTSYVEVSYNDSYYYDDYYGYCEEPYWHEPEWCDYYDDGSVYCVWYVDGWYEEWYQWDYDSCWEYNGSWY